MAYTRVNWQNGTVSQDGYVEIDGTQYPLVMPEYTGGTPLDATNLNKMDVAINALDSAVSTMTTETSVTVSPNPDGINPNTHQPYFTIDLNCKKYGGYLSIRGTLVPKQSNVFGEIPVGRFSASVPSFYNVCPYINSSDTTYSFDSIIIFVNANKLYVRIPTNKMINTSHTIYINTVVKLTS